MASREQINEIKNKLDIVSVVREYVPSLKHSGRNHFGLCPFHNEKTPSFSVNEELQRYKCFGCGESGDVINFFEKIEGVDFPKALEIAAKKAGVELKYDFQSDDKSHAEKKELLKVNRLAAEYFHYVMLKHERGKRGLEYAKKRKLEDSSITKFLIGYAPKGFDNLKNFLAKKGYSDDKLVNWSLLAKKNAKTYDKFRDRLIFPVFNHLGDIVGFSGRVINNDDIPKYLNSAETLVYKKSEILYGLFQGKDSIRKTRKCILVEGNVDVPMAHQHGIENIVAPMGTSLTKEQLSLLKRYCDEVIFCFDTDNAGDTALLRAFSLTQELGLKSSTIDLGNFGDLDDLIRSQPDKLSEVVANALPIIEGLMIRFSKKLDLSKAAGKSEFVGKLAPFVKDITDPVERAHYIQEIATHINLSENVVLEKLAKVDKKTVPDKGKTDNPQKIRVSQSSLMEENLIAFLLQYEFLRDKDLDWQVVRNENLIGLYQILIAAPDLSSAIDSLKPQDREIASQLLMQELGTFESDHEVERFFDELIDELTMNYYKRRVNQLKQEIREKENKDEDITEQLEELKFYSERLR